MTCLNDKCRLTAVCLLIGFLIGTAESRAGTPIVVPASGAVLTTMEWPADARSAALGFAGVSLPADAFAVWNQPASLLFGDSITFTAGYSAASWAEHTSGHTVSGFYTGDHLQGLLAGVRYIRRDRLTFQTFNDNGTPGPDGHIRPYDLQIAVGYTALLTSSYAFSLTAKYLASQLSPSLQSSHVLAFDIGLFHRVDVSVPRAMLQWGVLLSQCGGEVSYGGRPVRLPLRLRTGITGRLPLAARQAVQGTVEGGMRLQPGYARAQEINIGVEYTLSHFALRGGYHASSETSCLTGGCGLHFGPCRFEAAVGAARDGTPFARSFLFSAGYVL